MQHFKEGRNFINQLGQMEKAIYLLMDSSGMTMDQVIGLEFSDFWESISVYTGEPLCPFDINEKYDPMDPHVYLVGTWHITNPKTGEEQIVNNSTESTIAILDYLQPFEEDNFWLYGPLFVDENCNEISKEYIIGIFNKIDGLLNTGGCE